MDKRQLIGLIIALVLLTIGGVYFLVDSQQKSNEAAINEQVDVENKRMNLLKSQLDLYYLENGKYPINDEDFKEYLSKDTEDNGASLRSIEELNQFDYSVRGDGKAYKIKYNSASGDRKSVSGNYEEDYQ